MGKANDWLEKEPTLTLCSELRGNGTVIPDEAWMMHGEGSSGELDLGFFPNNSHDPERKHQELENLCEEDFYPDRDGLEEELSQEEREARRCDPVAIAKAGINLIQKLEIELTKINYDIVAIYLERKTDGLVGRFLSDLKYNRSEEAEAIVKFFEKMKKFQPSVSERATSVILAQARIEKREEEARLRGIRNNNEISQEAKRRLVAQAQNHHSNGNHLAARLGRALFGKAKFNQMLRATV